MKPYIKLAGLLLVLPWVVAGCGGGGGSSSGSSSVGVFVTDSPDTDNDHVWATLFKVELIKSDSSAVSVFDDASGKQVDLKSLRDSSGHRFLFLGNADLGEGTFTKVRVTIDDMLMLFPHGSSSGQQMPVADTLPRDAQSNVVVEFDLPQPKHMGPGAHEIVVDFDLANFQVIAGKIKPVCKEGDGSTLPNPERHEHQEYTGFVAELDGTAPNQIFKLALANGRAFPVATDEKTVIFNADGTPNPALANGKFVKVRGIFDVTAKQLKASEIKIKQSENQPHEEHAATVAGTPYFVDASTGTFKIMPGRAEGFVPHEIKIKIVTTANTHFWSVSGVAMSKEDFFAHLATATEVVAHGSYDDATSTITATEAKILKMPDVNQPRSVYARGVIAEMNAEAGTVKMSPVVQWEGFVPSENAVNVAANAQTVYKDAEGNIVDKAAWWANIHAGNGLKVEGIFEGGTITAKIMRKVL